MALILYAGNKGPYQLAYLNSLIKDFSWWIQRNVLMNREEADQTLINNLRLSTDKLVN